jgi:hypothetical protein
MKKKLKVQKHNGNPEDVQQSHGKALRHPRKYPAKKFHSESFYFRHLL